MQGFGWSAAAAVRTAAAVLLMFLWFVSAVLMGRTLDRFLPRRNSRFLRFCLLLVLMFSAGGPYWIGDANSLYLLPFFFAAFLICCEGPALARLTTAAVLYSLLISVGMMIDSAPAWIAGLRRSLASDFLKLACWAAILLFVRRISSGGTVQLSRRMWALMGMLSLAPLFAQLAFVIGLGDWYELGREATGVVTRFAYLILPFVALSDLALLYAMMTLSEYERLSRERQMTELSRSYYAQLEQQQRQVRRLRHDMANHLETLSGLPDGERDGYLKQLLDSPALKPGKTFSRNRVANVVLAAKAAQAELDETALDLEVSLPERLPVEEMDLCTLLSNAMDNALEACRKLPAAGRRITVRLRADKGMLVLRMENPCAGPVRRAGRRLLTSKPDADNHGIGTESIRSVVRKYGGSVEFSQREGVFEVLLYLPLKPGPDRQDGGG